MSERRSQPGGSRKPAQRDGRQRGRRSVADACTAPHSASREGYRRTTSSVPSASARSRCGRLQTLHEGFGRNFGAALSALLRSIVEVKLTSVDQLTYSEFVFSLENPTCFNLLRAEPLEGQLILDINPSILYPIIDRLLGGGNESGAPGPAAAHRNRTAAGVADHRSVPRRNAARLGERARARPGVDRVESNPQLVQIVPPNEVVVLISFELTHGRRPRHDEPVHPVQLHRADQQQADRQQLGELRQDARHDGKYPAHQQPIERCAGGTGRGTGRDATSRRRLDRPARGRHHHHRKGHQRSRW